MPLEFAAWCKYIPRADPEITRKWIPLRSAHPENFILVLGPRHDSDHSGRFGETGWMLVDQVRMILQLMPLVVRLEISDFAWQVNGGEEVKCVLKQLREHYVIKHKILEVWDYGDVSTRTRLIIVGFAKQIGSVTEMFEFPAAEYDDDHWHCARDVAVSDEEVPAEY